MTALPSAYVVVVSHQGPLDAALLDGIADQGSARLPFAATQRLRWWSEDCRVALLGFAGPGVMDTGEPWDEHGDGVTAFSGFPVPRDGWWAPSGSWAAQLRRRLATASLPAVRDAHFGVFTALALDGHGQGTVVTDPLGVAVLYHAASPARTAIATRASLAGIASHHPAPLRRTIEHLQWLLSFDNLVGDGTGYDGVRALPARTVVRVGCSGSVVVEPHGALSEAQGAGGRAVGDEVRNRLRTVASCPDAVWMGLTAGRDSRLLLAHVIEAGLRDRFRFLTWDLGGDDVSVASKLAAEHHLDHHIVPVGDAVPLRQAVDGLLDSSDGTLPATEAGRVMPSPGPFVSGIGGGLLGAVYGGRRAIRGHADVEATLVDRVRRRPDDTISRTDTIERQSKELGRVLAELAAQGWTSDQVLTMFFLDHRLHRWQGTVRESGPRADVAPLLAPATLATALDTSHRDRRKFSWHRRLVKWAHHDVARHPYGSGGGSGWTSSAEWPATARVLREELLDQPDNPVFEVVSYGQLVDVLRSERAPSAHVGKQLINTLGIARWANGH